MRLIAYLIWSGRKNGKNLPTTVRLPHPEVITIYQC